MFGIDSERFIKIYNSFESKERCSQIIKLNEELGELTVEFTKFEYGVGDVDSLISELADCFILTCQLMYGNDIEPEEIAKAMVEKLNRTDKRIETDYYEKHR